MSEELKPCPFCGGGAEIWKAHPENPRRNAWIACMSGCIVLTREYPTDAEAIAAWNTRTTPTTAEPVTDVDREAAFNTGIRLTKREWIEVYEAFAQHRALAIAAERARRDAEIVARLRERARQENEGQGEAGWIAADELTDIADAIERGEI